MSKEKPSQLEKDKRVLTGQFKSLFLALSQPGLVNALNENDEARKFLYLLSVRMNYKGHWGAGAEYLYRQLIQALGLQELEEGLVELAKPKRGRKEEVELAFRIWDMKAEGKTALQMKAIFESEGQHFSLEKIESYLKTRRKKPAT